MDKHRITDHIEPLMWWWITTVPKWMQPRIFWTGYYWVLDRDWWWITTVPKWMQPRIFWTGYYWVLDRDT